MNKEKCIKTGQVGTTRTLWGRRKMMIFTYTFSCLCLLASCKKEEVKMEYDQFGYLARKASYRGSDLNGKTITFYQDGKVKSELEYSKGQLHGICRYYNEQGNRIATRTFLKGKHTGIDSLFDEEGVLKVTTEYLNGKMHGFLRKYDKSGSIKFESRYSVDSLIEVNGSPLKK